MADKKKPTIVIVDSSKAMRAMLQDALHEMDAEIVLFENGPPAFSYLSDNDADLVFINSKLSGKDGLSLLQQVRHLDNHDHTPVVVISSKNYAQDQTIVKQLRAKFLGMPFSMQEIRDTVGHCLKNTEAG